MKAAACVDVTENEAGKALRVTLKGTVFIRDSGPSRGPPEPFRGVKEATTAEA